MKKFLEGSQTLVCGYISKENPFEDKKAWSGLVYKIRESIENAGFVVKWIPFDDRPSFLERLNNVKLRLLNPGTTNTGHTVCRVKNMARSVRGGLINECDFLFVPSGGEILSYIDTDKPSIVYGDATFKVMADYYFHNISKQNYREGMLMEQNAISKATIVCKASHWALNSVIKDFGKPESQCHVLQFGANLDDADIVHVNPYRGGRLNIFFSGVDWERKGASIAIDAVAELREKYGIDAHLVLCGIDDIPEDYQNRDYIDYLGFLNKNYPEQYTKYIEAIKACHLFLLPTKAECAGIVFCEASAYGLPIYTYDTGGIGDYVKNGINGYRLPLGASPAEFAKQIHSTLDNDSQQQLHEGCLQLYEKELNWKVWSSNFRKIVDELKILK